MTELEVLRSRCEELEAEVSARRATVSKLLKDPATGELTTLRIYFRDTCEDMECLEKCDSYGHEELCPVGNPMAAFRLLRARNEELERKLEEMRKAAAMPSATALLDLERRISEQFNPPIPSDRKETL